MAADLQVWLTDAGGCGEAALASMALVLSEPERRRSGAFVRVLRRRQFIVGRALARAALGELLGIAPAGVHVQERPGHAPLLAEPAGLAHFSISHSGRWVACAVSRGAAVGLDIETPDPGRDVLALADQAFGAEQSRLLAAMPAGERVRQFYRWWCAAEAAIKLGQAPQATAAPDHPDLAIAVACASAPGGPAAVRLATLAELTAMLSQKTSSSPAHPSSRAR